MDIAAKLSGKYTLADVFKQLSQQARVAAAAREGFRPYRHQRESPDVGGIALGTDRRRASALRSQPAMKIHHLTVADAFASLKSGLTGLSDAEVARANAGFPDCLLHTVRSESCSQVLAMEIRL